MNRPTLCGGEGVNRRSFPKTLSKSQCETCGSSLALELDHWDNDCANDDPSNAVTLCHACHELKSIAARTEGAAYAADAKNASFTRAVSAAKRELGSDGFRRRQDGKNAEWLRERAARTARMQAGEYVEVTAYRCTRRGHRHEFEHRSDHDDLQPTECPFCCSPLEIVKTYRIHKRLVPGQGWVETVVAGSEVVATEPERPADRMAAVLGAALFLRLLGQLAPKRRARIPKKAPRWQNRSRRRHSH